jgi:hypothetical protein
MNSYLLSNILQYILNHYLDHQDIEVYNRVFNFEFKIDKYIKKEEVIRSGFFVGLINTYLDDTIVKREWFFPNGNKHSEVTYKNGFTSGKYIQYDFNGKIVTEVIFINGEAIESIKVPDIAVSRKINLVPLGKCCLIC